MANVFILQDSNRLYLDRHGEWVDGEDAGSLYRTSHKDEAVNQQVELTVRHPELRIRVVECHLDGKGRPQLTPDEAEEPATG